MQASKLVKAILVVAGLIGLGVGAGIVLDPAAFHAGSGIVTGTAPGLLSELRGAGALILGVGLLALAGTILPRLAFPAALVSTLAFLGYGSGRLLSVAMDGFPGAPLLWITGIELAVGLACAYAVTRLSPA